MHPTLQILWEAAELSGIGVSFRQKRARFETCEEKILDRFGLEFVDELNNAWDELHQTEIDQAFEQGFLAAFRLWAEVYSLNGLTKEM